MINLKWYERIYALYKGEIFLGEGTIPEIATQTGKTTDFLRWMTHPAYARRSANGKKRLVMVLIDDEAD